MATVLEPAKRGEAEIRHFVIDEAMAQFSRLREAATRGREQAADPGTYAQLFVKGGLVMSDTQMERDSNEDFVRYARGDVLIAGLGLGMILLPLLAKKSVDIWPNICRDNLKDMTALHKRFRHKLRPHGWITSWKFEELKEGWF